VEKCEKVPEVSSTINFELFSPTLGETEHKIRVKLNDKYLNLEKDKSSEPADFKYTITDFKGILEKNLVKDWGQKCKISIQARQEST
jgi:hypothetical protein